jgi:hypothetical protein
MLGNMLISMCLCSSMGAAGSRPGRDDVERVDAPSQHYAGLR